MQLRITGTNAEVGDVLKDKVERQLRFAITRFTPSISDVSVALSDESGPKGAPAKKCKIVVGLKPKGSLLVEALDSSFEAAVSRAAERAGRSVARHLERKRLARKHQRRAPASREEPVAN